MLAFLRGPKGRLLAAALALLCLAAGLYLTCFRYRGFVRATAEIVDVTRQGGTAVPTVRHVVNGVIYTVTLDASGRGLRVGGTVAIQYDPHDPSVVRRSGSLGLWLTAVGAAGLAAAGVTTARHLRAARRQHGKREMGTEKTGTP